MDLDEGWHIVRVDVCGREIVVLVGDLTGQRVGAVVNAANEEAELVVSALTPLTSPWHLAGVTAGSVPAGLDADGAPVGVQVVGPWFAERRVLAAMRAVESLRGGPWPVVPDPPAP